MTGRGQNGEHSGVHRLNRYQRVGLCADTALCEEMQIIFQVYHRWSVNCGWYRGRRSVPRSDMMSYHFRGFFSCIGKCPQRKGRSTGIAKRFPEGTMLFALFNFKNSIRKGYGKAWFYYGIYNWSSEEGYAGDQ